MTYNESFLLQFHLYFFTCPSIVLLTEIESFFVGRAGQVEAVVGAEVEPEAGRRVGQKKLF